MPTTLIPVPAFCDDDSTPPPLPPTLTDLGGVPRPAMLLAEELLFPAGLDPSEPKVTIIPTDDPPHSRQNSLVPTRPPRLSQHHASPYSKKVAFQPAAAESRHSFSWECSSSKESSELSDDNATSSTILDDSKIPKPTGEPGHPGHGGYTLETALKWDPKVYGKFKKTIHHLIDEHLDVAKCASAQNPTLLKLIHDKATAKFPDLKNYKNEWPVTDMVMMHLKYTSSRARRQEIEMVAGKTKKSAK